MRRKRYTSFRVPERTCSTEATAMQHLGATSVNRKARSRVQTGSAAVPDGWFSIEPQTHRNSKGRARSGPDALGLASTVDPLTFLARKPSGHGCDERSVNGEKPQQNPRRRRLQAAGGSAFPAAEIFSPQRSLRLTKLPLLKAKDKHVEVDFKKQSNQFATATPVHVTSYRETELPLHELIQMVDDAVRADPLAELNQSAVARLFMDQWLRQFEADRRSYKSVGEAAHPVLLQCRESRHVLLTF
ncbi:unnamed protein product [Phytophthora lilii]|uniref:Unnamed protein product n=1 Tax=Phytophthora lilii TaxID=2077276 RepID=A0A9W6WTA0_9STRA|nr:unnamed protein product [Phytophthora lilii]